MTRRRLLSIFTAACSALLCVGCQLVAPLPPDNILRLSLNDSLKQYENVIISIVDINDTNKVLETVWSAPITDPTKFPDYTLTKANGKDFIVRVNGYKDGDQLFLETLIFYQGGKKTVVHKVVPPYKPRNQLISLTTSKGTLSPTVHRETLLYTLSTPVGISSVTLTPTPIFTGARIAIFLFPDTLTDYSSQPIPVGITMDTILLRVTDSSQGIAYSLAYRVALNPTLPPSAKLKSLVSSSGILNPPFNPDIDGYTLELAANVPSVTFTLNSQDPSIMHMTDKFGPLYEGVPSSPILVTAGIAQEAFFTITVPGGTAKSYQIFINRL